jgi:CEP19-like protein
MYEKNFVKPNDPNFVYDKRIQFKQPPDAKLDESWEW